MGNKSGRKALKEWEKFVLIKECADEFSPYHAGAGVILPLRSD
jgi:hypothetical protein